MSQGTGPDSPGKRQRRIRQSAVIPFRRRPGGGLEVLLITSIRRGAWIVPKGMVEPRLSEAESAAKEAHEEAGVLGRVVGRGPVGSYAYEKWGGAYEVAVFDLEVERELDAWPERDVRRRRWVGVEEAAGAVENEELRKMITDLPRRVGIG